MRKLSCGLTFLAAIITSLPLLMGAAPESNTITSIDQLNTSSKTVGVSTGSISEYLVKENLPNAQIAYYNDNALAYEAVATGKLDAFVYDMRQMNLAIKNGRKGVRLLDEPLGEEVKIAIGLSDISEIPDLESKTNSFIQEKNDDGTLDEMYERWVTSANDAMPDIEMPKNPNNHLIVGTSGIVPPYSYYEGTELTGYDIELAYRFAAWLDADVEFQIYDYNAVIAAAKSGKVDCVMANLQVTKEREESITFSVPLYIERQGVMVRGDSASQASQAEASPEFTDFSDLKGKRISMLTGAPFEELVRSKAPDIGNVTYLNSTSDLIQALKSNKTDAFLMNNAIAQLMINKDDELALFPQSLQDGTFGFAFAKGDPRRDEWQAAFDSIPKEDIQAAWEKWTGLDDSVKVLPTQDWPGSNGTLRVAACDTVEPMSYKGEGGKLQGFDIELLLMIAKELDVHLDFSGMELAAILSSVQSGKADIGTGSIIISKEREEAVDFVRYYPAAFVLIVRNVGQSAEDNSFIGELKASFYKTFIRENRWQLFVSGIITTLMITVFSIIIGTALGFLIFLMCRRGNPIANAITNACMWVVQGMPMVVLLMILFYLIFGKIAISGVIVAIIGFSITFGSAVIGMLRLGVGAVDSGQYEAARAIGFSDARTFFKIILPQALPHVMPVFRGEVVGLIKATAIVGYIAVQDLTKMCDIVRSRTYEAFFPLIAVMFIYFIIEGVLGSIVDLISRCFDYKKRSKEKILKGVSIHDKD